MKWLPERKWAGDNDYIFNKLPVNASSLNVSVKRMAKQAGIEKDICFHVSRHTFATTLLTLGADLYTTSKLLGHADLKTTQIYAEIVNKKKDEAVNRLSGLFNE
jgi:site-specific recombinase XerD